ncbi:helix-turn-helix domain-containing protein [Lacticaseibacillus saniviri]
MSVGDNIKKLRISKNMTQAEFAKSISISRSYLSELEHNKRNIGLDTVKKIAQKMEVSTLFLLTGERTKKESSLNDSSAITSKDEYTTRINEILNGSNDFLINRFSTINGTGLIGRQASALEALTRYFDEINNSDLTTEQKDDFTENAQSIAIQWLLLMYAYNRKERSDLNSDRPVASYLASGSAEFSSAQLKWLKIFDSEILNTQSENFLNMKKDLQLLYISASNFTTDDLLTKIDPQND